jgi:protocatechuate 3,4-dioxygenase beta subunit
MRILLLGIVLAAISPGQITSSGQLEAARPNPPAPAESAPVKPEERCTIEGTVLNSVTGEPLKKAELMLRRADPSPNGFGLSYAGASDAAGRFVIADIEPGRYRLGVQRAGFVNQQYGAKGPSSPGTVLTLAKSQKLKDLTFKLVPQAVITGRVLDEDGDPVPNVSVQAMRSGYFRGKKQWLPAGVSTTNDLGEYRIHGLAPGRYLLSAIYRPGGFMLESTQGGAAETYAPTYYPNAASPDSAAPLDVAAGAVLRDMDVRLQKTKTVHIRGRVLDPRTGKGARTAMINLQPKSDTFLMFPRNMSRPYNDKGEFVISSVTPGSYILTASINEDGKMMSARIPVEIGNSSLEDITLQPAPGLEINGRVTIEGQAPEAKITNMRIYLQPRTPLMFGPGAQGGQVRDDNTFTLTNVQPEIYDVRTFGAPDGSYIKSIRVGDADVIDSGLDIATGAAPGEMSVVIAMSAGQITGAVQNEKLEPAAGATVVLIPEGKRRESDRWYQTTSTDQYGNYTLKNIAPGEYRVYAFDTVEFQAYMDPEWLKPFETKGEKVSIEENAKPSVQLRLIPTQGQQ